MEDGYLLQYILRRNMDSRFIKIGKRTETLKKWRIKKWEILGNGVKYTNISIEDASKLDNVLITAIDKKYYEYLDSFPNKTGLVIHDPTEVKGKSNWSCYK